MKDQTKIQLLPFEMGLVINSDIILTKNGIIQKLKQFLEELQLKQQTILEKYALVFPKEVLKTSYKISKGENYKGLPWLVLDYPRHFKIENILAIRTLFWWGNFCSVTLHLSGKYKIMLQKSIIENLSSFSSAGFYLCVGEKEWEHHFEPDNYKMIAQIPSQDLKKIIFGKLFIKIAIKIPLDQLNKMEIKLLKNFELLLRFCN